MTKQLHKSLKQLLLKSKEANKQEGKPKEESICCTYMLTLLFRYPVTWDKLFKVLRLQPNCQRIKVIVRILYYILFNQYCKMLRIMLNVTVIQIAFTKLSLSGAKLRLGKRSQTVSTPSFPQGGLRCSCVSVS